MPYTVTHVRNDGVAHTLKLEGYGAEALADKELFRLAGDKKIVFAVVFDDTGAVRHWHTNRPAA